MIERTTQLTCPAISRIHGTWGARTGEFTAARREAYAAHLPAMLALAPEAVLPVPLDVDVNQVLITVRAARMAVAGESERLNMFPASAAAYRSLTGLEQTLCEAELAYRTRADDDKTLADALRAGKIAHERLFACVQSLALRGLLSQPRARRAKPRDTDVATDLIEFSLLLRRNWDKIQHKVPATLDDLAEAERIAESILTEVDCAKQRQWEHEKHLSDMRVRAFTLLFEAYQEMRRGLHYVRWHEQDFDKLAPPLVTRRKPKRGHGPKAS